MWPSQDSALSSYNTSSFKQDSQCSDFSHINTQDVFSQNNSGPQNEVSQQSYKKMSMYEKWLNKRSLFKRDTLASSSFETKSNISCKELGGDASSATYKSSNGGYPNRPTMLADTFSGSLGPMSKAQAVQVGQHDRDLLEHVKNAFHDSNNEVKTTLDIVKKKMESVSEATQEQLANTITAFLGDIWKQQESLQKLFEEQNKTKASVVDLEKQIAMKECRIAQLEDQLSKSKRDDLDSYSKVVKQLVSSPHLALDHKLEDVIKLIKDTKEEADNHLHEYKQSLECYNKHWQKVFGAGPSSLRELEKKILGEVKTVQKKFENCLYDVQNELKGEFGILLSAQSKEITDATSQVIKQSGHEKSSFKNDGSSQQKELLMKQFECMSKKLENVLNNFIQNHDKTITSVQMSLMENIQKAIGSLNEKSHADYIKAMLSQFEDRIINYLLVTKQNTGMEKGDSLHIKNWQKDVPAAKQISPFQSQHTRGNTTAFYHCPLEQPHNSDNLISQPISCQKYATRSSRPSTRLHPDSDVFKFPAQKLSSTGFMRATYSAPCSLNQINNQKNQRDLCSTKQSQRKRKLELTNPYNNLDAKKNLSNKLDLCDTMTSNRKKQLILSEELPSQVTMVDATARLFKNIKDHIQESDNLAILSKPKKKKKHTKIYPRKNKIHDKGHLDEELQELKAVSSEKEDVLCLGKPKNAYKKAKMAKATSCKFVPARISENTKMHPTPCLELSAEQERINNIKKHISASDQLKFWAAKNEGRFSNKMFPSKDNRVHSSDKQEVQSYSSNSTLAAFLCKRSDVKSYFPVKKTDSCNSSPTLSITEVTIKNIRGPFRSRTPQELRHSNIPRDATLSPAPTLLSQISSLM